MVKKVNKVQNNAQNNVQNQQVNNNDCQHVQLGGMAYYDDKQYFLFSPDSVNQGVVEAFRRHGVAQQMATACPPACRTLSSALPTSSCSPTSTPSARSPWPPTARIPSLRGSLSCPSRASPWR